MSEEKLEQLVTLVQQHHGRIYKIEGTLAQTPDPQTLRDIEHVYKELPATDALKECVKARSERAAAFKRISLGAIGAVAVTITLATLTLVWQGIALALHAGGKP